MHQGWPKFVQNLWYATSDNGIAALVYGEMEVSMKVADGQMVKVGEKTSYPFKEDITFTMGNWGGCRNFHSICQCPNGARGR